MFANTYDEKSNIESSIDLVKIISEYNNDIIICNDKIIKILHDVVAKNVILQMQLNESQQCVEQLNDKNNILENIIIQFNKKEQEYIDKYDIAYHQIKELNEYKTHEENRKILNRMIEYTSERPTLKYTYQGHIIPIKIASLWSNGKILNIDKNELMNIDQVCKPPKNIIAPYIIKSANDLIRYLICNYEVLASLISHNFPQRMSLHHIIWDTFFHLIKEYAFTFDLIYNRSGVYQKTDIHHKDNIQYHTFVINIIPKITTMPTIEFAKFIKYMYIIRDIYDEGPHSYVCGYAFAAESSSHGKYVHANIKNIPFDIDQDLLDIMINVV